MLDITNKDKCSGCSACVNVCSKKCISLKSDNEGFLYPKIDAASCIRCGACKRVCPIINNRMVPSEKLPVAYACINKDCDIQEKSSSGGVFSLIAEFVINRGGVVFGAAFNENLEVEHIPVDKIDELERLRGSKYVQSKIGNTYNDVRLYLEQGRWVLFTGTPCQVAGLKSFLKKDYPNLICQDIVCHGVPSPLVWKYYVKYRENCASSRCLKMFFRHKNCGWKTFSVLFLFKNNTEYVRMHRDDPYMKAFLLNYSLRPSCYSCKFKGVQRLSDFTLADFWQVRRYAPDIYDENGVSLVFLHTSKAKEIFETLKEKMKWVYLEDKDVGTNNYAMIKSVKCPRNRNAYFHHINSDNFDLITTTYCKHSLEVRIKNAVKTCLMRVKGKR